MKIQCSTCKYCANDNILPKDIKLRVCTYYPWSDTFQVLCWKTDYCNHWWRK